MFTDRNSEDNEPMRDGEDDMEEYAGDEPDESPSEEAVADNFLGLLSIAQNQLQLSTHPSHLPGRETEMVTVKDCILFKLCALVIYDTDIRGHLLNAVTGGCLCIIKSLFPTLTGLRLQKISQELQELARQPQYMKQ